MTAMPTSAPYRHSSAARFATRARSHLFSSAWTAATESEESKPCTGQGWSEDTTVMSAVLRSRSVYRDVPEPDDSAVDAAVGGRAALGVRVPLGAPNGIRRRDEGGRIQEAPRKTVRSGPIA